MVKTLVDNSHKSIRNLKKEFFGDDISDFVVDSETLTSKDKNIEVIKPDFPDDIEKVLKF